MKRGFTLLEVIVAVAILGMGVGLAMQIFSSGLKNIHRVELASRGMNHVENVMSEILSDENILGPMHAAGPLDDDFEFQVEVNAWEPPQDRIQMELVQPVIALLSVDVEVRFRHQEDGDKVYRAFCLKPISLLAQQQGGNPAMGLPDVDPIMRLFGGQ